MLEESKLERKKITKDKGGCYIRTKKSMNEKT